MTRYYVVKEGAYLMIPEDADSSKATFTNDKSKATAFVWITAKSWAWDLGATLEKADE